MRYCTRCKRLYLDSEPVLHCPECKRQTVEEPNPASPVLIATANGFELERILSALKGEDVPCTYQHTRLDTGLQILNSAPQENCNVFVSLQDYEKAVGVLAGIGAISDESVISAEEHADALRAVSSKKEAEELTPEKARVVRILSGIGFLLLIVAAVYLTDLVTGWIRSLF